MTGTSPEAAQATPRRKWNARKFSPYSPNPISPPSPTAAKPRTRCTIAAIINPQQMATINSTAMASHPPAGLEIPGALKSRPSNVGVTTPEVNQGIPCDRRKTTAPATSPASAAAGQLTAGTASPSGNGASTTLPYDLLGLVQAAFYPDQTLRTFLGAFCILAKIAMAFTKAHLLLNNDC
jgi:hypothetical protein